MFLSRLAPGTPPEVQSSLADFDSLLFELTDFKKPIGIIAEHMSGNLKIDPGESVRFVGCGHDYETFCMPFVTRASQTAFVSTSCLWTRESRRRSSGGQIVSVFREFHGKQPTEAADPGRIIMTTSIATNPETIDALIGNLRARWPGLAIHLVTGVISEWVMDFIEEELPNVTYQAVLYGPPAFNHPDPYWSILRELEGPNYSLDSISPSIINELFKPRAPEVKKGQEPQSGAPGMSPGSEDDGT